MYKIQFINAYSQSQAILVRISPEERWQQEHYYFKKTWMGIRPLPQQKKENERKQKKKTGSNRLDKQKRIRVESNHKQ